MKKAVSLATLGLCLAACGGGGSNISNTTLNTTINTAPRFVPDQNVAVLEDDSITISLSGLLPNANTLFIISGPDNGSLGGGVSDLTYTPDPDFNGVDSATVRLRASPADSLPFDVIYDVTQVDDAPRNNGHPSTYDVEGFDDVSVGPDIENPDGLPLTTTAVNVPPWATVDSAAGRIVGTPTNAELGSYPDIRMTVSNSAGAFTTDPFAIDVAFGKEVVFDIDMSTAEFTQTFDRLRIAVAGDNVLIVAEGVNNLNQPRVGVRLFDPITGLALWDRMLPSEPPDAGELPGDRFPLEIVRAYADGFIITSSDGRFGFNGDGILTGIDLDGNTLWEFMPSPLSPGTTALPWGVDALADGRILASLSQSRRQVSDPFLCGLVYYDPVNDTQSQTAFDSGITDAPCARAVNAENDGRYWLTGGEVILFSGDPTDAWVRQYNPDDSIQFTTVLAAGGYLDATARHPSGDLLISFGNDELLREEAWIGRIDEFGVLQLRRPVMLTPGTFGLLRISDIAVQPDGAYSAIVVEGEFQTWSTDDVMIEQVVLPQTYMIEPHPAYDVLHSVEGRIESLPLPPRP